jgi:hypothetical protein
MVALALQAVAVRLRMPSHTSHNVFMLRLRIYHNGSVNRKYEWHRPGTVLKNATFGRCGSLRWRVPSAARQV